MKKIVFMTRRARNKLEKERLEEAGAKMKGGRQCIVPYASRKSIVCARNSKVCLVMTGPPNRGCWSAPASP